MNDERRYSEAELHAIFERAAKRQEEAHRAEAASQGALTLTELQQIGEASGIDPAHVAAAAAEVARGKGVSGRRERWPRQVLAERWLSGPVSDETWEAMVETLRRDLGKPGVAGQVGRTREWTTMGSGGRQPEAPVSVTLRPEGNQTRLAITQSWEEYVRAPIIAGAVLSFMALLLGGIFAVAEPEALLLPVFFALLALLAFGAGPPALRTMARRREATFERLLDRLDLLARDEAKAAPTTGAVTEPEREGRLGLGALPDPAEESASAARSRTRS